MELSKVEKKQLSGLAGRLKAAEQAVKDLEVKRRDALAAVFEGEDDNTDTKEVAKLRKTAQAEKERLSNAEQKVVHLEKRLKGEIGLIVDRRAKKVPAALADIKKAENALMAECGRNLARVAQILSVLGPHFQTQVDRLSKIWSASETGQPSPITLAVREAYDDAVVREIRNIHQERNAQNNLKSNPQNHKTRLYARILREAR